MPSADSTSDRVAHDVRNALMPIRLRLDALELVHASPQLRERVATLRAHAARLERLADGMQAPMLDCLPDDATPQADDSHDRATTAQAGAVATRVSVLCFDDNALLTEALGLRLALESGLQWLPPRDTLDDAVAIISAAAPQVVLLDLGMPGAQRPLDVIAAIRACGLTTRVIVLTGATGAAVRQAAREAGAHGFVSKSAPADRLVAAIRRVAAGEHVTELDA